MHSIVEQDEERGSNRVRAVGVAVVDPLDVIEDLRRMGLDLREVADADAALVQLLDALRHVDDHEVLVARSHQVGDEERE